MVPNSERNRNRTLNNLIRFANLASEIHQNIVSYPESNLYDLQNRKRTSSIYNLDGAFQMLMGILRKPS